MNRPISVWGFGPNLLGFCTKRGLQDQLEGGEPPVLVPAKPAFSLYFYVTNRPGLSVLGDILAELHRHSIKFQRPFSGVIFQ